jgi:hypothetical protein
MKTTTLKLTTRYLLSAAALAALLAAPAARAQMPPPLNFTLTPPAQAGPAGSMFTFTGVLSNPSTTNTVFLNGDSPTFNGPGTIDDRPFASVPLSLAPAGSTDANGNPTDSYTGPFFSITLDPTALPGTYFGTFTITGGANDMSQNPVATEDFSVTVPTPAVPEASTTVSFGLLLALGAGSAVVSARRRKPLAL